MNYYSDSTYPLTDDDTSTDTETIYDTDEEEIDELYDQDEEYIQQDKITNNYYIGICKQFQDYYLLVNTISPRLFYKTPYALALKYLKEYSIIYIHQPQIEIMKLIILNDGTYSVIKKTYWLRIIQKHWKKVLRMRNDIYNKRMMIFSQYSFQLTGRYPFGLNVLPGLVGMLREYNHSTPNKFCQ